MIHKTHGKTFLIQKTIFVECYTPTYITLDTIYKSKFLMLICYLTHQAMLTQYTLYCLRALAGCL